VRHFAVVSRDAVRVVSHSATARAAPARLAVDSWRRNNRRSEDEHGHRHRDDPELEATLPASRRPDGGKTDELLAVHSIRRVG